MSEFNPVVASMESSVTLALNAQAKEFASQGRKIYNLTAGEPDYPTPSYIQEFVAQKIDKNKYTPASGLLELRDAIAHYCCDLYHIENITRDNIIVTPGAKPALFTALTAVLQPAEEVIVPTPAWVSYKQIIEVAGGEFVPVDSTDGFDLNIYAIKQAITPKTKVILINSPNNPTGAVYSEEKLRQLSDLLSDKNIYVLSDDIYIRLVYGKITPITQCGFNPDKLIIVNGFSKSQALTGWRVGYIMASNKIASMIGKLNSHILGNTSLPGQYAALAALEVNDDPPMLNQLEKNRDLIIQELKKIKQISFVEPRGAFYAFLDIRKVSDDSVSWCQSLLETKGVALVPGDAFGAPGFVRMSFTASESEISEAIALINDFINEDSQK